MTIIYHISVEISIFCAHKFSTFYRHNSTNWARNPKNINFCPNLSNRVHKCKRLVYKCSSYEKFSRPRISKHKHLFVFWKRRTPRPAKRPRRKAGARAKRGASELVPVTGLEPVRVLPHGILSPGRLPIPPHRLIGVYIVARTKNCVKKKRDKPACAGHGKEMKDSIDTKLFT